MERGCSMCVWGERAREKGRGTFTENTSLSPYPSETFFRETDDDGHQSSRSAEVFRKTPFKHAIKPPRGEHDYPQQSSQKDRLFYFFNPHLVGNEKAVWWGGGGGGGEEGGPASHHTVVLFST